MRMSSAYGTAADGSSDSIPVFGGEYVAGGRDVDIHRLSAKLTGLYRTGKETSLFERHCRLTRRASIAIATI
jgi:hypothetical protein